MTDLLCHFGRAFLAFGLANDKILGAVKGQKRALHDVLAETQSAILPPVPWLDTLRWVFIALALLGIAIAIHVRIDDWKRGQR